MGKVSKNKTKIKGSASSKKQNESKKKVKKQVSKVNDNLNNSISSRGKYSSFDRNEESNDNEYINIKNDSLEEPKKVSFQTKSSVKLNLSKSLLKEKREKKSSNMKLKSIVSPKLEFIEEPKLKSIHVNSNEKLTISSPSHITNRVLSEKLIKSQNINSFSIFSPKKLDFKKVTKDLLFGSLENDCPLKILGLRKNDNSKKDFECLVSWKTNLKKLKIEDSVVDYRELRLRYPELLLDFFQERMKFN